MKKNLLIGITCAGIAATGLVFAAESSGSATPKMNYAGAATKSIVYSGTANTLTSLNGTYNATTLSSGVLSGESVVKTTISSSNMWATSSSDVFLNGNVNADNITGTFIFSAGLTGLRSVTIVLENSDGTSVAYNTYPSETDVATPIDQGTLSSGVMTTFTHTTANYIGISFSRTTSGNIHIVSITLTWNC
jgi:hypothetical protein